MRNKMTKQQEMVTMARRKNILVSAAAGSGKTWVLVKRIMKQLKESRIDIHKFLIVTFTKAAAGEMKERIAKEIQTELDMAVKENIIDDEWINFLNRQNTLVHKAPICTIDSFCKDIVKQYFMKIDIDPQFRIADDAELNILIQDTLEEIMETEYENAEPGFLHLLECYVPGKDDKKIKDMILSLYHYQMAQADPSYWINCTRNILSDSNIWYEKIMNHVELIIREILNKVDNAITFARNENAENKIMEVLLSDKEYYDDVLSCCITQNFDKCYNIINTHERYNTLRKSSMEKEAGEYLQNLRDRYKALMKSQIESKFFKRTKEELEKDRIAIIPDMNTLLNLSMKFARYYEARKKEKGIVDFCDIEHFALNILTENKGDGTFIPSEIARKIGKDYFEIMIDEYQDSNFIQENILSAITGGLGFNNMFMVGDMKQSIYRFRMARPELFIGKHKDYETFSTNEDSGENVKIELDSNFRSCPNVLESINYIFYHIMHKEIGGINYDKVAALKPGTIPIAPILSNNEWYNNDTELLIFDKENEPNNNYTDLELEAKMIASKIKELTDKKNPMLVHDSATTGDETQQYRPATYRDIVILLRSPAGKADIISEILNKSNIPAHVETNTGYFSAMEVRSVLSYLTILNNKTNDIEVTAVLRSYFGKCSAKDLAYLFAKTKSLECDNMMQRINCFMELQDSRENDVQLNELKTKLKCFLSSYKLYEQKSKYLSICELLKSIYEETGYADYISALPAGERRKANLYMLLQKAADYEKTNFRGLFEFITYIQQLEKYNIDYGEANVIGEHDNAVRIMSIHKSKGLEFPIVFVSNLAGEFNKNDVKNNILLHPELGVGPNIIDNIVRTKHSTVMRDVIALDMNKEMLGEELRVLYVALTRAKEKCILTANVSSWGKKIIENIPQENGYTDIIASKSYLDWILISLAHHKAMQIHYSKYGLEVPECDEHMYGRCDFIVKTYNKDILLLEEKEELISNDSIHNKLLEDVTKADITLKKDIQSYLKYEYPYADSTTQVRKYSVSQLKQLSVNSDKLENEFKKMDDNNSEKTLPRFLQVNQMPKGATAGTYIHKFMQLYNFTNGFSEDEYNRVCDLLTKRNMPNIRNIFKKEQLKSFFDSNLGKNMIIAAQKGKLYKEVQFVVGFPKAEIISTLDEQTKDDLLLVQGVIDAYYENEKGDIVIMDYKTDKTKTIKQLKDSYKSQLSYYKKTIEQIKQKPVVSIIIYSFYLNKEILL